MSAKNNWRKAFTDLEKEMKRKREEAIEECCIMVEADAKTLCPVDSGTLKRSITHEVKSGDKSTKGSVGSNVEYAYWAERNKPYLEPAVDMNTENMKRKIAEVLKK
jgi:hypothetical protein